MEEVLSHVAATGRLPATIPGPYQVMRRMASDRGLNVPALRPKTVTIVGNPLELPATTPAEKFFAEWHWWGTWPKQEYDCSWNDIWTAFTSQGWPCPITPPQGVKVNFGLDEWFAIMTPEPTIPQGISKLVMEKTLQARHFLAKGQAVLIPIPESVATKAAIEPLSAELGEILELQLAITVPVGTCSIGFMYTSVAMLGQIPTTVYMNSPWLLLVEEATKRSYLHVKLR